MMACKHCGTNWKKDVTFTELYKEIEERKALAHKALDAQMAIALPRRALMEWLTVLNAILAVIGVSLFTSVVSSRHASFIAKYVWGEAALFLMAGFVFFLILSPTIYWMKKGARIVCEFKKEHPEYAEALRGD